MSNCNNCGDELTPVFDNDTFVSNQQFQNAMHFQLHPGYGEYFDGCKPINIFFCGDCSAHLVNDVMPNLKEHIYDELGKEGILMDLPDIEGVMLFDHWENPKYAVREGEWVVVLSHRVDLYRGKQFGKKVMEINHNGTAAGIESAVKLALGVK